MLARRRGGGSYEFLGTLGDDAALDRDYVVIGEVAGAEGAAAAFVDALTRHCGGKAPGSVPTRARSLPTAHIT